MKKALCYVFNNSTSEIISWHSFSDLFLLTDSVDLNAEEKAALIASTKSPISFLSKLGQSISRKRTPKVTMTEMNMSVCLPCIFQKPDVHQLLTIHDFYNCRITLVMCILSL